MEYLTIALTLFVVAFLFGIALIKHYLKKNDDRITSGELILTIVLLLLFSFTYAMAWMITLPLTVLGGIIFLYFRKYIG